MRLFSEETPSLQRLARQDMRNMLVYDRFERPLFLFANEFTFNRFKERHEELELVEALDVNNEIQVD